MRTPNTKCILCAKPLYRRPPDLRRARYAACYQCRSRAQSVVGITEAQAAGLAKARKKGTNHRTGYVHRPESKAKVAESNRRFWAAHPELALQRAANSRGELAYNWKGGQSRLNLSIRQMHENRKWMDAVKERDGACVRCGSAEELESHHIIELAILIERCCVKTRADARHHAAVLWDLSNGETLCRTCHWRHHGRTAA